MHMSGNKTVFIGNIPYGVSEDVITSTLERVGQVNHFRLVYDKETGKPKGFGFAEYADADQAAAAVRNLNEFELAGRKLRVDYSNDGKDDSGGGGGGGSGGGQQHGGPSGGMMPMGMGMGMGPGHQHTQSQSLPALPPVNGGPPAGHLVGDAPALPEGASLGPHLTAQDAISQTIATIPPLQLLDAMQQMQDLCRTDPDKALMMLKQAPQLGYAITQILILMKLTDQNTLAGVIQQTAAQAAAQPQGPPQGMPQGMPPQARPPPQQYAPPPQQQQYAAPPQGYNPTPPVGGMPYPPPQQQPPQQQAPPPQQAAPAPAPGGDQAALIAQVIAMTREQIDALNPGDRDQILQLRRQLGAPVPGYINDYEQPLDWQAPTVEAALQLEEILPELREYGERAARERRESDQRAEEAVARAAIQKRMRELKAVLTARKDSPRPED